jgi:hypothetical protein
MVNEPMSRSTTIWRLTVLALLLRRAPRSAQRVVVYMALGPLLAALVIVIVVALATPSHARNIIDWQCGDQPVSLEVDKSTDPATYDITFFEEEPAENRMLRMGRLQASTWQQEWSGHPEREGMPRD